MKQIKQRERRLIDHVNRSSRFILDVYQMLGGLKDECFDSDLWNMKGPPDGWSDFSHKKRLKKTDWMDECMSITDEADEWYEEQDEES